MARLARAMTKGKQEEKVYDFSFKIARSSRAVMV